MCTYSLFEAVRAEVLACPTFQIIGTCTYQGTLEAGSAKTQGCAFPNFSLKQAKHIWTMNWIKKK